MHACRPTSVSFIQRGGRTLLCFVPLMCAMAGTGVAQVWEKIPAAQWSAEDASKVLTESPWVSLSKAGYRYSAKTNGLMELDPAEQPSSPRIQPQPRKLDPGLPTPERQTRSLTSVMSIWYRIRLLTARPVREAYLSLIEHGPIVARQLGLEPHMAKAVSVEELTHGSRLERFMKENPNDIRLTGSDRFIVLTVTEIERTWFHNETNAQWGNDQWTENARSDVFMNLQLSDIAATTVLATKTGKKASLVRFEPPGRDNLGARMYFPRLLADGTPLVTLADRELRFESRIGKHRIEAKFDLRKLVCNGKLEF